MWHNLSGEKKILIAIIALTILGFIGWLLWETKPKPGTQLEDLGRTHVPIGTEEKYNSNPPTSGPHFEEWIKAGVYDAPRDDRNLVHSLEHGYVIISYNCSFKVSSRFISTALADELEGQMAPATESATPQVALPQEFNSDFCKDLVKKLSDIYESKNKRKLIVIPKPNLDATIALTAWRYIDKFNNFDKSRVEKFIDAQRDQGPEKTVE